MIVGANYIRGNCEFTVWAPNQSGLTLILADQKEPIKMEKAERGYWHLSASGVKPGAQYWYSFNGETKLPDPASHFQPEGVFGPSAVVDHESFIWKDDNWSGIQLEDMIMYELHTGTFSQEGTFAAAKSRMKELIETGINAIEIMPVSQFSGARNWGYDAVFPFAVQNTYGGPNELKRFVQECHSNGVAAILDVVYNHLGPEGNFLKQFGPYFLSNVKTPWGDAVNFGGPQNFGVRNFFLENAVYWLRTYHFDGLRLDAVYAMVDKSQKHFLKELSETVETLSKETGRKRLLIGENDRVDAKLIGTRERGGYGLDATWHDNLHHSMHAMLTEERNWYYANFGSMADFVEALHVGLRECTIESNPKEKTMKDSAVEIGPSKLVVFSQNHDQIGNRPHGERLIKLAGLEAAKLAAAIVILSAYTPLLFMGEEYGEDSPFLFFTDYSFASLARNVQTGRRRESVQNGWREKPLNSQSKAVFTRSKIDWQKRYGETGCKILGFYKALITLRKVINGNCPAKRAKVKFSLWENTKLLTIRKQMSDSSTAIVANFNNCECKYLFPCGGGKYLKMLDSSDDAWGGSGSALPSLAEFKQEHVIQPLSVAVYMFSKKEKNHD